MGKLDVTMTLEISLNIDLVWTDILPVFRCFDLNEAGA